MPSIKVVSRVWSAVSVYVEAMSFLAALLCVFTFATPQASASTLGQIKGSAVAAFLSLLGTDQATINNVAAAIAAADIQSSLTASADASSPAYSLVPGGTLGVTLGVFKFHATGEAMNIQKVGLMLDDSASLADLSQVYIYDGATLVGTAFFSPSAASHVPGRYLATSTLSQPVIVPQDSDHVLTIRADIAQLGVGQPARSGDMLIMGISSASAVGVTSGNSTGLTLSGGFPFAPYGTRIVKSYPTVSLDSMAAPGSLVQGTFALMRFKITANSKGGVGLAYITPTIASTNVTFSSVRAYAYTDAAYSQPIASVPMGNVGTLNPSAGLSGTFSIPISGGAQPIEVPAGQTYYFQILGTVTSIGANATVITTVPGDAVYVGLGSYGSSTTRFGSNGHFIWSPNSTSTSSFAASDWMNGFGLPGLPAAGISQTLTGNAQVPPTSTSTSTTTPPVVPPTSATFSASPISGSSPLQVTFAVSITNLRSVLTRAYTIDFGDSHSDRVANCYTQNSHCNAPVTNRHTYAKAGTYTAKLLLNTQCNGAGCVSSQANVVGTATVTVTEKVKTEHQDATSTPAVNDRDKEKGKDKESRHDAAPSTSSSAAQPSATTTASSSSPAPTCTLAASKASVTKNTDITLTWTSVGATYASSQSGAKAPAQGSITYKVNEDSTFIKKVYGPGGMGICQVTVQVTDDKREGAPAPKVVVNMQANTRLGYFNQLFSSMQLGAVVVAESYEDFLSGRSQ